MSPHSDKGEPSDHLKPAPKPLDFLPNRSILVVSNNGLATLDADAITPTTVGWKAFGLSALPHEWVPSFFVVCEDTNLNDQVVEKNISSALKKLNLSSGHVFVRSSAGSETIADRGRFDSDVCSESNVVGTIQKLAIGIPDIGAVHWIVQEYISPERKGHLSNERQMSREPRDWVAEFEIQGNRPGYTVPIAVRTWRDGSHVSDFDLIANSEALVTRKLKQVALWGTTLARRIHFEWIWSGAGVWIVQADLARVNVGVNPNDLIPLQIQDIQVGSLEMFKLADDQDYERYGKLRNAHIYKGIGYDMPVFFILNDRSAIEKLFKGEVLDSLKRDLDELTKRPVVIRTDGINIPKDKREMLPRSESLHSCDDACKWLVEKFAPEIQRIGIGELPICLIVHHFIPSVAAAWARAEPNGRIVRIESLWGLPEGLYWHSHDTFEVDLLGSGKELKVRQRLRFKRTFVAPDKEGNWIHFHPIAPFDWGSSIRRKPWIFEIAKITHQIAAIEKRATTVMWFIDNHSRATKHQVLPWFHSESALETPKAAPRRKLTMATDFTITSLNDWANLQGHIQSGGRVERVILDPRDPQLVRNQEFARQLAEFASKNRIVVELAGGILSHAYYMLQRHGAQVECIDLFGAEEETIEYNKLVRDKIPGQIKRRGESVEVIRLQGEALLTALRQKLVEEAFEVADAKSFDDIVAELADVLEVINGICGSLDIRLKTVVTKQKDKRKNRGGFREGLMLTRTSTPQSLAAQHLPVSQDFTFDALPSMRLIERSEKMPFNPTYRRPDMRSVDDQREAILTFETELSRIRDERQITVFDLPIDEDSRTFRLVVEATRNRSLLWSQVHLKLEPTQMKIKLESDSQLKFWPDDELNK
jgi:predicted house-cleaning noncanonical NTP pyrophosphatase (MazG superfamily)